VIDGYVVHNILAFATIITTSLSFDTPKRKYILVRLALSYTLETQPKNFQVVAMLLSHSMSLPSQDDSALGSTGEDDIAEQFYNPASHIASYSIDIPKGDTIGVILSGQPGQYEG